MNLKLDILKALMMIVVGDRAVSIGAIAAVEVNPHGTLHVHLLSGEKLMFQDKEALEFIDQITEGVRASQRAAMKQASSSLIVPRG